jgi:DNA-binding MarR family transcriptional regulator
MSNSAKPQLPIGYWLKQADNVLTEHINHVHATNNLSRTDWQVLNTLYEVGPVSQENIFTVMHTFVDEAELATILTRLVNRGWTNQRNEEHGMLFQLTDQGRHQHSAILNAQKAVRQRAMQGISDEEYGTVIRVLQRIVNNLERDVAM